MTRGSQNHPIWGNSLKIWLEVDSKLSSSSLALILVLVLPYLKWVGKVKSLRSKDMWCFISCLLSWKYLSVHLGLGLIVGSWQRCCDSLVNVKHTASSLSALRALSCHLLHSNETSHVCNTHTHHKSVSKWSFFHWISCFCQNLPSKSKPTARPLGITSVVDDFAPA